MKISYRRTGGFAGMVMAFDIDTQVLSQEETEAFEELVNFADFFALPSEIPSSVPHADQFQYELTIEAVELAHTVHVGDSAVPEELWPLLNKIRVLSRSAQ